MKQALFLDRDGVLNERIQDAYVKQPDELKILDGAGEAVHLLAPLFDYSFVATNQQGIGKGLMTIEDLKLVHQVLEKHLDYTFDEIYYCPHLAIYSPFCRKPQPGMAYQALDDFPDINMSESVMVGDMESDMQFARSMNMKAIQITTDRPSEYADENYTSLLAFANAMS